jgi:hypothetical protein
MRFIMTSFHRSSWLHSYLGKHTLPRGKFAVANLIDRMLRRRFGPCFASAGVPNEPRPGLLFLPSLFRCGEYSPPAFGNEVDHRLAADRLVIDVSSINQSMQPIARRRSADRSSAVTGSEQLFQNIQSLGPLR